MPHHHMQMLASTTSPRPAAAAAGKFNSSTTLLRAPCGLGYAPSYWALRVRQQRNELAHQSNFPAASAAPQPCAFARSESVLKKNDAQGCGSAYASGRGEVVVWWWGYKKVRNADGLFASIVPRSNPPEHIAPVAVWWWGCKEFRNPFGVLRSFVPRRSDAPEQQRCSVRRESFGPKRNPVARFRAEATRDVSYRSTHLSFSAHRAFLANVIHFRFSCGGSSGSA
jgi:hypothetical protein